MINLNEVKSLLKDHFDHHFTFEIAEGGASKGKLVKDGAFKMTGDRLAIFDEDVKETVYLNCYAPVDSGSVCYDIHELYARMSYLSYKIDKRNSHENSLL